MQTLVGGGIPNVVMKPTRAEVQAGVWEGFVHETKGAVIKERILECV